MLKDDILKKWFEYICIVYVLLDQWNEINIYHIYNVKPLVAIRIYILIVPYIVIIIDLYFSSLLINHGFSSFIKIW